MLHAHSHFSLRYGILSPEEVLRYFAENAYDKPVLTDINSTSAALGFIREASKLGKSACVGIDFRNGTDCMYVVLARNNAGYQQMNALLSEHLQSKAPFPVRAPFLPDCHVIYPWKKQPDELSANEWTGFAIGDLNRLQVSADRSELIKRGVILQPMTFRGKRDFNAHRLLRAIDNNVLLSRLPKDRQASEKDCFTDRETLEKHFEYFPELIRNSQHILAESSVYFDFGEEAVPGNKATFTDSKEEDYRLIRRICEENLPERYPDAGPEIHTRIDSELDIIRQKDYLSYFLITWEFTSYARSRGFYYVGRGSGANSIIAYLLKITDVDPFELDLYFERFINLYRRNPPDFDIDFSWKDRDEVIAHIFEQYPNVALLCTYNTFQFRATVREMGKVFGLPAEDIDLLSSGKVSEGQADETGRLVLRYSKYIAGFPSHLSIHAGGIIISEKPLTCYSAVFHPPKGLPTTQFSMLEAEDVGLYKFDVLSQRGLSKIRECLEIVSETQPHNPPEDIHNIAFFKNNERIKSVLRTGKAIGCFYVESPAMRMLMLKLQVDSYLGLVAASSIIRPGVANSGMMREYILRHRDPERRKQAHPQLAEIMRETYGVMVYQEDVIKVAHHFAGLTLAEADILRRGMSGKYRSRDEFQSVREKFHQNCLARGYSLQDTQDVWTQIESFAGYAFSKGHSASYAVESYQSLYLKTHYPLEYMVATINNFGGYYHTELYVHEARMLGAQIEAPHLNCSGIKTRLDGQIIYLGFELVSGLESRLIEELTEERRRRGPFGSFEELVQRLFIPPEQLHLLIRIGALRDFPESRKELFWKAYMHHGKVRERQRQPMLFRSEARKFELPELDEDPFEASFEQLELLGFALRNPFDLSSEKPQGDVKVAELKKHCGLIVKMYGYLVAVKKTSTKGGEHMYFGTWLDYNGDFIDSVHFPEFARRYPFQGKGIYELKGVVTEEFGHYTLETGSMRKLAFKQDLRYNEQESGQPSGDVITDNFRKHPGSTSHFDRRLRGGQNEVAV